LEGVRDIIFQVIHAVGFCHSIGLTHTDLKLENVLFVDDGYNKVVVGDWDDYRVPNYYAVKLIDFGNATYQTDYHSRIINTRQYRAPEVLLGTGWNEQSDIWSIGCILAELWTGNLLFQTHENIEHLALMEKILETPVPTAMIDKVQAQIEQGTQPRARKRKKPVQTRTRRSPSEQDVEYFLELKKKKINWPTRASSDESKNHVKAQKTLKQQLGVDDKLFDLCKKCLTYEPRKRINALKALQHPFLKGEDLRKKYLRKGIDVLTDKAKSKNKTSNNKTTSKNLTKSNNKSNQAKSD
jgi:serine/threonine protein kinase